ncbi:MAG: late promoter transcription accessory protein [Candidatus Izemoplasma sp.]
MSKKDEFSEQVILEHSTHPEYTLLETLETIRETHGYDTKNIKKYLTSNLIDLLQVEAQKNSLIQKTENSNLSQWFGE